MKKENILAFRKKNNLTQVELAVLLETNMANVSSYERGYTGIPQWFVEKFEEISILKGINLKEEAKKLLGIEGPPPKRGRKPKAKLSPELLADALKDVQRAIEEKSQKQSITESKPEEQVKVEEQQAEVLTSESLATATDVYNTSDENRENDVVVLEKMSDNRPASEHYHAGKVDVWQFADENFHLLERIGFHRVSALKYVTRFGKKDGYNPLDIDKAIVELQKLKELTKGITRQEEIF